MTAEELHDARNGATERADTLEAAPSDPERGVAR